MRWRLLPEAKGFLRTRTEGTNNMDTPLHRDEAIRTIIADHTRALKALRVEAGKKAVCEGDITAGAVNVLVGPGAADRHAKYWLRTAYHRDTPFSAWERGVSVVAEVLPGPGDQLEALYELDHNFRARHGGTVH